MKIKINWNNWLRTIGGMKFAVVVISLFTLAMIIGTFLESYYGTDFANRIVYKSIPFMLIQGAMFLSIIFAVVLRMPMKKRLYGFYTIHAGLVIIGIGAAVTYGFGVDGNMGLATYETSRNLVLSKDIFKITYPDDGTVTSTFLPYTAFETNLNKQYKNIKIIKYLPFSEGQLDWIEGIYQYSPTDPVSTGQYIYKNAFATEDLVMSINPEAQFRFPPTANLGPLSVVYMHEKMFTCFKNAGEEKVIFWNAKTFDCFTANEKHLRPQLTMDKKRVFTAAVNGVNFMFAPEFSPYPIDNLGHPDKKSSLKVLSLFLFEKAPALFLFGKHASFYSKTEMKWHHEDFPETTKLISLPWMGAEIQFIKEERSKIPFMTPYETLPIQKNGKLIKGDVKAVQIEILGKRFWVTNDNPLSLNVEGKNILFQITKESFTLPFELTLTKFKMEKDPGTDRPASYESFVKLFDGNKMTEHHISMNHPMKAMGFTFYQASYTQEENGSYSSSLSVNIDPGRWIKYFGSLILVLGSMWHYQINKKKQGI